MSLIIEIIAFICIGCGGIVAFFRNFRSDVKNKIKEINDRSAPQIKSTISSTGFHFTELQKKCVLATILAISKGNEFTETDSAVFSRIAHVFNFDIVNRFHEINYLDNIEHLQTVRSSLRALNSSQIEWFLLMLSCMILCDDNLNSNRIENLKYILNLIDLTIDDLKDAVQDKYTNQEFDLLNIKLTRPNTDRSVWPHLESVNLADLL